MPGRVEQITIRRPDEEHPSPVERVRARASQGLEGDRNFLDEPAARSSGEDLTLIEAEALEAFAAESGTTLEHWQDRRNVLTRGVGLNELVGREFTVGDVRCRGVELCEPCRHLQSLTYPEVLRGLVHRAGLRADVLEGGWISVGDEVRAGG
jgi:MOSC domain-containing protein YiiM